jgi:hypothetical protein
MSVLTGLGNVTTNLAAASATLSCCSDHAVGDTVAQRQRANVAAPEGNKNKRLQTAMRFNLSAADKSANT